MTIGTRKAGARGMVCAASLATALGLAVPAGAQTTERVSVGWMGNQSNNHSWQAVISGNGRFVAFESLAGNLVADDTNGVQDVFVHDRLTGATVRVSVAGDGTQGDRLSSRPSISHDGRFIAFSSAATNLVAGDINGFDDVFVHDLQTGETVLASLNSDGLQADGRSIHPAISADGGSVVFHSEATNLVQNDANPQWDVFAHDLDTGETFLVSLRSDGGSGNDWSEHASISGDGRLVVYHSDATNLVDDDTNDAEDVFLFDRATGMTTRISVSESGEEADGLSVFPSISPDGRYVAFESEARNLVPGDTNARRDILVRDLATSAITRVSLASDGSEANGDSYTPSIGREGCSVAFASGADNLVTGDTNSLPDAFVHDLVTGETVRVSLGPGRQEANGGSSFTTISASGRFVAFQSSARNLVGSDTNLAIDVFVRDRGVQRLPALRKVP